VGPDGWTALHDAARAGDRERVHRLLADGADPNAREGGDNTYPMHWAAAAGHLEVVTALADAGGDVIGAGDDHELDVIGWATCWEEAHEDVAEFLVGRGARHTIFSAIALNLADEVARHDITTRMSRNEEHQLPLHFAIRKQRPEMVAVLIALGADPLATDGAGHTAAAYAHDPDTDRAAMEAIRPRNQLASLALHEFEPLPEQDGALHLMARRGDPTAVGWLLDRGADPNALWSHWRAQVTPLHLAALFGHVDVIRTLLGHGADRRIRDSEHDTEPYGWAVHMGHAHAAALLRT
jgi:ankyrin repeat protein